MITIKPAKKYAPSQELIASLPDIFFRVKITAAMGNRHEQGMILPHQNPPCRILVATKNSKAIIPVAEKLASTVRVTTDIIDGAHDTLSAIRKKKDEGKPYDVILMSSNLGFRHTGGLLGRLIKASPQARSLIKQPMAFHLCAGLLTLAALQNADLIENNTRVGIWDNNHALNLWDKMLEAPEIRRNFTVWNTNEIPHALSVAALGRIPK